MLLTNFKTNSLHIVRFILLFFFVGLPVYLFSYFFFSNYVFADSLSYTSYWNFAKVANSFQDLFNAQFGYIGSNDAGYSLIIGLATLLPIGRFEFFSLLNSIVAVSVFYAYLRKWTLFPLYYSLMFLSYYIPVLFFAPERLRLSFYILFFSFLANSIVIRIFLIILSLMTHAQIVLLFGGLYLYLYYKDLKLGFLRACNSKFNKQQLILLIVLLSSVILFNALNPQILIKIAIYSQNILNFKSISLAFILIFVYRFSFISQALFCASLFVFTVSAYYLGGYFDRTIIMLYFIYLVDYFAVFVEKPRCVILFYLLLFFTTWKSILFYSSVISGGGGFSN